MKIFSQENRPLKISENKSDIGHYRRPYALIRKLQLGSNLFFLHFFIIEGAISQIWNIYCFKHLFLTQFCTKKA